MSSATKRKSSDLDDAYPIDDVTPTNSPPRKRMRITRSQKQALMDNLQLEITERARKLRAQYALQAQDLRARLERRVNRIPIALRKANIGELLEKHNAVLRAQLEGSPRKYRSPTKGSRNFTAISASGRKKAATASPSPRRVRKHSPAGIYSDKENAPASGEQLDVIKNPKRRVKPGAASGTSRIVSQEVRGADYRILSPKSSNSRTYPQSPLRASPEKAQQSSSYLSRPMSPLKPSSPLKSTSANRTGSSRGAVPARPQSAQTTRPGSRAATGGPRSVRSPLSRPATRQGERRGSVSSSTSSGTTVAHTVRSTASRKVTTASTASAAAKKVAVARAQAPSAASKRTATSGTRKAAAPAGGETATGGRRTLRKRA
ncbi:Borealin N terminal-domain-containing protein [Aspergillus insuetus]